MKREIRARITNRLALAKTAVVRKRYVFLLSPLGRTIAGGFVTFAAAGFGSVVAEELGKWSGGQLVRMSDASPQILHQVQGMVGTVAAIAAGVIAVPKALRVTLQNPEYQPRAIGRELIHSFRAGWRGIASSQDALVAAAFLGGSFSSIIVGGGWAPILSTATAGAMASAVGAAVTTGLTATLDYPARAERARARKWLRHNYVCPGEEIRSHESTE